MRSFRSIGVVGAALLGTSAGACGGSQQGTPEGLDAMALAEVGADAQGRVVGAGDDAEGSLNVLDSGQQAITDAGASDADSGVVTRPTFITCSTPTPVLGGDSGTGFVECGDSGVLHRAETVACPVRLPRASSACTSHALGDAGSECTMDSDCTAKALGTCNLGSGHFPACGCSYGCVHDSDCASGQICQCGDPVGTCVSASCNLDSQCPAGSLCAGSPSGWGGCSWDPLPVVYACESAQDSCLTNADCTDAGNPACGLSPDSGVRGCGPAQVACPGRPFLIDEAPRLAPVTRRDDWSRGARPCTNGLQDEARSQLAAYWMATAQMEHASVAAFARFALELLALGAPPDLLVATYEAMADETLHARLAFSLASAYGLDEVGPGPLAVDGAIQRVTARGVFATLVREGCIGETVAAVLATEAYASATDPVVRAALSRIAQDEARHAGLAWRTARWLVEASDEAFARWAEGEVMRAIAEHRVEASPNHGHIGTLRAHGLLDADTQRELVRAALRELVVPHAGALFAGRSGADPTRHRTSYAALS